MLRHRSTAFIEKDYGAFSFIKMEIFCESGGVTIKQKIKIFNSGFTTRASLTFYRKNIPNNFRLDAFNQLLKKSITTIKNKPQMIFLLRIQPIDITLSIPMNEL